VKQEEPDIKQHVLADPFHAHADAVEPCPGVALRNRYIFGASSAASVR
jgi:hypothetical protein